jgi:hypothetical protein
MASDGSDVALLLEADAGLLRAVSDVFSRKELFGRRLEVDGGESCVRVSTVHLTEPGINVPISQAGEGAGQLLPIIAGLERLRSDSASAPSI